MPIRRKVIVHIGTEKTGSTSLQHFLAANRPALLAQGFAYPESVGKINHVKLCGLSQAKAPKFPTIDNILGITDDQSRTEFLTKTTAALEAEISAFGRNVHTILFSNEHLHSGLVRLEDILRLRGVLAHYANHITIAAYIRRQDQLAASLFSTRIKSGEAWKSKVFPEISGRAVPYYFNYDAILSNYENAFGHDAVNVQIFEAKALFNGDIIQDFAKLAGLCINEDFKPIQRINESLSYEALYTLALLNKFIPPWVEGRWNTNRDHLIQILESRYGKREPLTSQDEARSFYDKFMQINEAVRSRFFPTLDTLFSEDFSRYPETINLTAPSHEDVAEIFACLWNEQARLAQTNHTSRLASRK